MSNNGPRFQTRYEGFGFVSVRDSTTMNTIGPRGEHQIVCACQGIETAIIIARALNRDAMS